MRPYATVTVTIYVFPSNARSSCGHFFAICQRFRLNRLAVFVRPTKITALANLSPTRPAYMQSIAHLSGADDTVISNINQQRAHRRHGGAVYGRAYVSIYYRCWLHGILIYTDSSAITANTADRLADAADLTTID